MDKGHRHPDTSPLLPAMKLRLPLCGPEEEWWHRAQVYPLQIQDAPQRSPAPAGGADGTGRGEQQGVGSTTATIVKGIV